jgi:hypothetical protein
MNLFDMPEELSPRLQWMKDQRISTMRTRDHRWVAYKSETPQSYTHDEEIDAVVGLAKKLKIKLWKE